MRIDVGLMAITIVGTICAQETKWGLHGVLDFGGTNSQSSTQFHPNPPILNSATDLDWGLDLNLRTFILDPRFITLTFMPSIQRGSGHTDSQQTRNSDAGGTFYLDLLKASFFPFRFHFIDHSLDYSQQHINSATVARRSIGFDWTLRRPNTPPLFVNYDTSRFDYEFTLTPATVTRTSNLLVGSQWNYAGWAANMAYGHESSTQAFTGVGTNTDLIRATANRDVWSKSQLSINTLYERLGFSSEPGIGRLEIPFISIRADLRTRHTSKLSTTLSHQFYRTGRETTISSTSPGTRSEMGSTVLNDLGGQMSYRLSSSLVLAGAGNAAFVTTPVNALESAARTVNLSGSISWERKFHFIQTRASYVQGIAYAGSNLGHSRRIPFEASTAGLSLGDPRRLLLSADGVYSRRPDLYEIGGSFGQKNVAVSLETQAVPRLLVRASVGANEFEYLTLSGRERIHTSAYSFTVLRSIFSVTASRNSNVSLRNLLEGPLAIAPQQLFVKLPVETLINAPLSGTTGVYTTGAFGVRPRRRFEFEARYLRQRVLFSGAPNVLLRQYEAYGTYHLGKFLFTAGVLYSGDSTENLANRLHRYYFFRISRPFRIL